MLSLNIHQRYFIYRGQADMRKGFNGLCGLVRDHLQKDPLSGDVFVFINKRKNQIKLLCWEKDGYMMFYKRLEKGTFEIPKGDDLQLKVETLSCLLQGIKLNSIRKRKRYIHAA
jgi:transposase